MNLKYKLPISIISKGYPLNGALVINALFFAFLLMKKYNLFAKGRIAICFEETI